jgi:hypothetical protein
MPRAFRVPICKKLAIPVFRRYQFSSNRQDIAETGNILPVFGA